MTQTGSMSLAQPSASSYQDIARWIGEPRAGLHVVQAGSIGRLRLASFCEVRECMS